MYVEVTKVEFRMRGLQVLAEPRFIGDSIVVTFVSCKEVPQAFSDVKAMPGYTKASLDEIIDLGDFTVYENGTPYHIDNVFETYLVDVSDDGESMRLVCPPGVLDDDVNLSSECVYAYNEADSSVVGVWESSEQAGWYFERYGLQDDGTFASVDGGLYDFERDNRGNIVEGYESALETYFEVAKRDGDMFCGPDMFELASNAYDRVCNARVQERLKEAGCIN